jgi:hypothetical protein
MKQVFSGDRNVLKEKIWSINLEPIVVKLIDAHGGTNWSLEHALVGAEEYRKFLFLTVARPETIVPTEFVDEVWHTHILDTMKYEEDCKEVFGFFLHHFPYFGIRGDDDQALLQSTFKATAEIYREEFGSSYFVRSDKSSDCGGCGTCGSNSCGSCAGSGFHEDHVRAEVRPTLASAECSTCGGSSCSASSCGSECSGFVGEHSSRSILRPDLRPSLSQ